ncbi:MAG: alpha/beta fold hydrolase [Ktedonobacterales bacterium]|nr:alpha/beta fold hydrolase [Ktedonobacterales bacterium]
MTLEQAPQYAIRGIERISIGAKAIPALVARPETAQPRPAVLIQHGYGSSKEDVLPIAVMLAAYGFVTVAPDAWGHGERLPASGPSWMTASSADQFLTVVRHTLEDLREALAMLATLPEVRADAVIAAGFSMGAMASLILGTEDARVAGVVSVAGSPLPDLLTVRLFGADAPGEEATAWAREHDAVAHIGRFAPRPLLLQHGRADDMVPVAGTLRLYEGARPFYATYPDHLSLRLYDHTHFITEAEAGDAIAWLLAHFAPPPAQ